jgi:hypothetical protein
MITSTNKLLNLAQFNSYSDTFIETGTCYGDGTERAIIAGYPIIRTVEMQKDFYDSCEERFKNYKPELRRWCQVHLYLGKSSERLPEMLLASPDNAVIFLDAHPAGKGTGGHDDLMKNGAVSEYHQNVILLNELNLIINHSAEHIIIIDDQHGEDEYNRIYMAQLLHVNPQYKFEFYDEQLTKAGQRYKDKLLVCIPH